MSYHYLCSSPSKDDEPGFLENISVKDFFFSSEELINTITTTKNSTPPQGYPASYLRDIGIELVNDGWCGNIVS